MKKEKTIRTYQRRTKTGKVVTVKQHTAKYDAAEALKEAAKKKGAGDELEGAKKKGELDLAKIDAFKGDPNELSDKERQAWQILTGNYPAEAEPKLRKMKSLEKVWAYADAKDKKRKASKGTSHRSKDATDPYSAHGFTKDEFKEWYEGTGSKADKKVEKALKKAMGTKAYNALSDKAADEYKKGGAHRFFTKGLEEMKASTSADKKSVTPSKETKEESLKVGSSVQMGNSTSLGKGKKETFKVLAVQKTNKQDRELGNTEAAWVQRKDGSVTLALKDSEKGWMYDDTWTDFTDKKHPYAKSLEAAGYSFKKAQGKGGKYWEVSKESVKGTKEDKTPKSSPMEDAIAKYAAKGYEVDRRDGAAFVSPKRGTMLKIDKKGNVTKTNIKVEPATADKKVPTWTAASAKKINSKESFRKLSTDSRLALNDFIRSQYKGQKYDLGHPSGHVHYVVDGYAITNEGTSAPESRKKFGVRLKPVSTGPGDPGSYRYLAIEDLKKYKMKK